MYGLGVCMCLYGVWKRQSSNSEQWTVFLEAIGFVCFAWGHKRSSPVKILATEYEGLSGILVQS